MSRLFIFSDAVVAISATLLITIVLKLSPPSPSEDFWQALLGQGGLAYLLAFGLSFAFILHFWRNHLEMTDGLRSHTGRLLTINGFWLGTVAFLPFPTYWFAASTSVDARGELSFYLLCLAAVGAVGLLEAGYLHRHSELFVAQTRPQRPAQRVLAIVLVAFLLGMAGVVLILPGNLDIGLLLAGLLVINRARWWEGRQTANRAGAESSEPAHSAESVARLVLFSDAVVAIAVTLLALPLLDLATPNSEQTVLAALAADKGPIFAFVLCFFLVSVQWRLHHRTMDGIRDFNSRLLTLNGWWLAAVVFLPLPTEWFGRDFSNPRVTAFMWACQGVVGLIGFGIWFYLSRHPELTEPQTDAVRPHPRPWYVLAGYLYMLVLAGIYSQVGMGSNWALLVVGLAIVGAFAGRRRSRINRP